MQLHLSIDGSARRAEIEQLVIAGWTGRDPAAIEHHIVELEALGVARPRAIPMFYRVATQQLTCDPAVQVVGTDSSGEVEFVLLQLDDGLYIGLGSDHTDRKVEAYGITVSKQVCAKPLSADCWAFADVAGHWDQLLMRSWLTRHGVRTLYQEGPVTSLLAPQSLIDRYCGKTDARLPTGTAMFCGTLGAIGGVRGGEVFEMALIDPVRGRTLQHRYEVQTLPIVEDDAALPRS